MGHRRLPGVAAFDRASDAAARAGEGGRFRRALAHSIVRLLPEARRVEPNPPFYKCSEMLYALDALKAK